MPLINALFFLALILLGLAGYALMQRFEKRETTLYLEWVETEFKANERTSSRVNSVHREDLLTVHGKKAG